MCAKESGPHTNQSQIKDDKKSNGTAGFAICNASRDSTFCFGVLLRWQVGRVASTEPSERLDAMG